MNYPMGCHGHMPPIFLNFMQFSGKNCRNNRLAHFPLGFSRLLGKSKPFIILFKLAQLVKLDLTLILEKLDYVFDAEIT